MKPPGPGLALILAVAAASVTQAGRGTVGGLSVPDVTASLLLGAVFLLLNGWAVERARHAPRALVGALAMWAIFATSAAAVFVHRDAVRLGAIAWTDELGLTRPEAVVTGSGELAVTRGREGSFLLPGRVNGRETRFIFDTGATAVVLTAETAATLGFTRESLNFRIPISTANGQAFAAPVVLDRLSIGPIGFARMPALVAGPGMLHENLLGQTFLERLGSYEVRGRRLVLRAPSE